MPRRIGTYIQVKSYSRHLTHFSPQRGCGTVDYAADWRDTAKATYFDAGAAGFKSAGSIPTLVTFKVGDRTITTPTPIINTVLGATLDARAYKLTGSGWEAVPRFDGVQYMHLTEITPQAATCESAWNYPPDPIFAVSLWRGEANAALTPAGLPLLTSIVWGGAGDSQGQFRIVIPYGDAPSVEAWNKWRARWEPMRCNGGAGLPSMQGNANGQWLTLWVGHWGGRCYISPDGFWQNVSEWEIPEFFLDAAGRKKTLYCGYMALAGPVRVGHTAGECGIVIHPIWMPSSGAGITNTLTQAARDTGYVIADNPSAKNIGIWYEPVYADPAPDGTLTILKDIVASSATVTASGTAYTWAVTWDPEAWTTNVAGSLVYTYKAPSLQAVQVWQNPHISSTGSAYTSALLSVAEAEVEYPGVMLPTSARLTLYDETTALGSTVQDYRRLTIKAGAQLDNGSHAAGIVFSGHMITPGNRFSLGNAQQNEVYGFDCLTRLRDMKAGVDEPDVSLFAGNDVLKWVCMRSGLPSSVVSGPAATTTLMDAAETAYNPETRSWVPQFGRTYEQVVGEAMQGDGKSVYYAVPLSGPAWQKIVRTNGPFAATSTNYTIRENASKGLSVLHFFDGDRQTRGHDSEEQANVITVLGKDDRGRQIALSVVDPNSFNPAGNTFAGGWDHVKAERDDTLTDYGALYDRAAVLQDEVGTVSEYVTAETDMIPGLRYGEVVAFSGPVGGRIDRMGARSRKYRVEAFKHRLATGTLPRTTVTARYIGDM